MRVNGLSPQTEAIFEDISKLECIKEYCLIGGTALALQMEIALQRTSISTNYNQNIMSL